MVKTAQPTRRRGGRSQMIAFKPLRAGLAKIAGTLKVAKVAQVEDTKRKDRSSPVNDSPVMADIRKIVSAIKQVGGLEPYELAFTIDLDDPETREKLGDAAKLKTLLQTLNGHCRKEFVLAGLPPDYVHKAGNRIYIAGPEIE